MNREHPQYKEFQQAVELTGCESKKERLNGVQMFGELGHPDGIKPLSKMAEKGLKNKNPELRIEITLAMESIVKAIKEEQPTHPIVIASKHIDPKQYPNAFSKLCETLTKGGYEEKTDEQISDLAEKLKARSWIKWVGRWAETNAKQLKEREGNLKE